MSREEILKIRTCALKVDIHCDGCKHKVKKLLHKIEGVYKVTVDSEQGKVTVLGNVDPNILIKKLVKSGKHAEIWGGGQKCLNNNQIQFSNQFKNIQIDKAGKSAGGGGKDNKSQQKGGKGQHKGGGGGGGEKQIQQLKGLKDLNLPQLKDMKLPPFKPDKNTMKLNLPEDDYDYGDDEDFVQPPQPLSKMKPMMVSGKGGSGGGGGNGEMLNAMLEGLSMDDSKSGSGGDENYNGGKQTQGGKKGKSGGKDGKKGGGGGGTKSGKKGEGGGSGSGGKNNKKGGRGSKNECGGKVMNDMNNMMYQGRINNIDDALEGCGGGENMGQMMMRQVGQIPAVQGLPSAAMNAGRAGYFQGHEMPPYMTAGASMMHGNGNEGFHSMMYARPPPAVSYYPPPVADPYTHYFSDDNTTSCNVM